VNAWLPVVAGTGSAVAGGFYFAFSAVVMPALRRRPAPEAAAAMAAINERAVTPPFMILFFGTAAACGANIIAAATDPQHSTPLRVAGSVAYLTGWALTMAVNVPLNNRLASTGPRGLEAMWDVFEQPWTRANHVRAALSLAGALGLMVPVLVDPVH
jgi:uncharacterized membrane protein